jgi:putative ABC transport system permease protein
MNRSRLMWRSAWFNRRSHAAVMIGAAIATAALVGSLTVGDSVRHTLQTTAMQRIGAVRVAMPSGDRLFNADLADRIGEALDAPAAAVLMVRATVSTPAQSAARNEVQLLGVDERFWPLAPSGSRTQVSGDEVALNGRLAGELGVEVGDEVVVRFERVQPVSYDAPLAGSAEATVMGRVKVERIVRAEQFGSFGLAAGHVSPRNLFVPRTWLAEKLEQAGLANLLLIGGQVRVAEATTALRHTWQLADAGLQIRALPNRRQAELTSDRIFMGQSIMAAATKAWSPSQPVMTYFVNELCAGDRATPYSFVAGINEAALGTDNLAPDQIIINQWLADDLAAGPGDVLTLRYFMLDEGRRLREETRQLTVARVLPMQGAAVDPALMPAFAGLSNVEDCRQWEAGVPIDLSKIRDKDEQYWDAYRGTPKAFICYETAREMWRNRFGAATAIRFDPAGNSLDEAAASLREALNPAVLGLGMIDVRGPAERSAAQALDFGGLFIGLSFFLIAAALLLTGLLFGLAADQRMREVGLLRAVGFQAGLARRLILGEAALVAGAGTVAGCLVGLGYAKAVLWALVTVWRGATNAPVLLFDVTSTSIILGGGASFIAAMAVMTLVLHRHTRREARQLLAGQVHNGRRHSGGNFNAIVAGLGVVGAVALLTLQPGGSAAQAGIFFGAGALLLIAGLGAARWALSRAWIAGGALQRRGQLAIWGLARRPTRSAATMMIVAVGVFLVVAIGANRLDPMRDASARASGTGGFALYAEATMPVLGDLNTARGREMYALDDTAMAGVHCVSVRVAAGDDASCLNLARAQQPRLLGIDPAALASRFTFMQALVEAHLPRGWAMLRSEAGDGAVPAVGDEATVVWGLGRQVGDVIEYRDAVGRAFDVRIVGIIANSMLQGSLIVDRAALEVKYPDIAGYGMLLIDAPPDRAAQVSKQLTAALADRGVAVEGAAAKLTSFAEVQNTYLAIFLALGAMAVMLGSAGLAAVVGRNVIEREGELALLRAVGFEQAQLRRLLQAEHVALGLGGLVIGAAAAAVAVWPSAQHNVGGWLDAGAAVGVMAVSVVGWTAWAVRRALHRPLIAALRTE